MGIPLLRSFIRPRLHTDRVIIRLKIAHRFVRSEVLISLESFFLVLAGGIFPAS